MSAVVEETEVTVTCTQKKNDDVSSCTTPPVMWCLGGNDEHPPHPDFANLPRPIATPLEKTKKRLTKHIRDESLKETVYRMYRGEFVAKLMYTKNDDGTESLIGMFGVSSEASSDSGIHALIGHSFVSIPMGMPKGPSLTVVAVNTDGEFNEGLGTEHTTGFLLRLWHHTLRQHASSLPSGAVILVIHHMLGAYVSMGDSMLELLVDTVVIAVDCFLLREEDHVCKNGISCTHFAHMGEYLESKGQFAAAAAIYEVLCHVVCPVETDPRSLATLRSYVGLAHKRNQDYYLSEASYIKSLQYLANGNAVNFADSDTQATFHNLLSMYTSLGNGDLEVRSNENMLVHHTVTAILLMGGYKTTMCVMPSHKTFLKEVYRTRKKAQSLFTRAVLSGTQSDFRRIILSGAAEGKRFQVHRSGVQTAEQIVQAAKQAASEDLQGGDFKPMIKLAACSYCNEHHTDDSSCQLMRCPCRAVAYCKKECQVAHWPEHKKHCAHLLQKKMKSVRKN